MKSAKEYRSELATIAGQVNTITTAWEGKEGQDGYETAMGDLRKILGKADEAKAMLTMAMQSEGLADLIREPANAPTGVRGLAFRDSAPGEGVLSDPVLEAISRPEYTSAFEAQMRRGDSRLGPNDRKTLQEGIDESGGQVVPEDWRTEVIKKIAARPSIRANARVFQTGRDAIRLPKVVYTADYRYSTAARMKWVGETPATSTQHRVTEPVFGSDLVQVHTGMASIPLTMDILEDAAFPLDEYVIEILSETFDLGEEAVFISGTGVGQPQGILTHPLIGTVSADTNDGMQVVSGDAALLTSDGLINLAMQVPEQYDIGSKWYFNKRSVESAIRKLKEGASGQYMWPVVSQVGNLGPHGQELLGYPTVRTPFMPNIAAGTFPILFGDMRGYAIVDRIALSIQRLNEVYAETNIVVFLARKRVGGKLLEPWKLKVQKVSA